MEVERKSDQSLHVKSVSLGDIKASCPPKQNELELNCGCLSRDQVMMLATIGLKVSHIWQLFDEIEMQKWIFCGRLKVCLAVL